LGFSLILN